MAGIISYGAYIPLWRLARDAIAEAWGSGSIRGERSVAKKRKAREDKLRTLLKGT